MENSKCISHQKGNQVFGTPANPEIQDFPEKPNILNVFPIENNSESLVKEVLKRDLSQVTKIRFDPVNRCNQSCIFCPNNLGAKPARISTQSFEQILKKITTTCNRIIFGCAFEPLMEKDIQEYAYIIKSLLKKFKNKPKINLVTNGTLLNKRNIDPFVDICDWFHISLHSCKKDNFEFIQKSNFDALVSNVKMLRCNYPKLKMHAEMVITKINYKETDDYISWAFNDLNFNTVNMRLVSLNGYHPNSYLAKTLQSDISLAISEKEWNNLISNLKNNYSIKVTDVSSILDSRTPVIELHNIK